MKTNLDFKDEYIKEVPNWDKSFAAWLEEKLAQSRQRESILNEQYQFYKTAHENQLREFAGFEKKYDSLQQERDQLWATIEANGDELKTARKAIFDNAKLRADLKTAREFIQYLHDTSLNQSLQMLCKQALAQITPEGKCPPESI